jgi:hypothetical protein
MESEMERARTAEPKVLTLGRLAAIAIETRLEPIGKGFRQEEFAFAEGSEGNGTSWVRAFLKHSVSPVEIESR